MNDSPVIDVQKRPAATGGTVHAFFLFVFVCGWTVFTGTWVLLCVLFNAQHGCRRGYTMFARGIMAASGVRTIVTFQAPLDPNRAYVFLSNHQSALDIPILMNACLPAFNVRFLAKESLFKLPFMGWAMSRTGYIPIRRENPRHSAEQFQQISKTPAKIPYSYIIFPEGTRSPEGRLQPFKKGSIGLALRMGLPVVPVSLIDACRANPKGKFAVRSGTVRVVFHAPIELPPTEGPNRENRDALEQQVYAAVLSALPDDQRP